MILITHGFEPSLKTNILMVRKMRNRAKKLKNKKDMPNQFQAGR
jgi:hypothetical protein